MTDDQVIHVDHVNRVASALLTAFIVVIGGNANDQHITYLIFTGATYDVRLATHPGGIVMPWMIMTDGDDRGVDLTQPSGLPLREVCVAPRFIVGGRKGIGNQCNILATQLEASVAKPGNFHLFKCRFSHKFGRGPINVLARTSLYHKDRCSTSLQNLVIISQLLYSMAQSPKWIVTLE